jgi:hypothetical protein
MNSGSEFLIKETIVTSMKVSEKKKINKTKQNEWSDEREKAGVIDRGSYNDSDYAFHLSCNSSCTQSKLVNIVGNSL